MYASRVGDEPWFCFEQPDRERIALATLGAVRTLEAAGPDRFDELARRWRALADAAIADTPGADEAPGTGLTAVGGFAFAPDGGGRSGVARVRRRLAGRPGAVAGPARTPHVADGQRRGCARR